MNERVVKVDVGINKLDIKEQEQVTAGDTNSHFINLKFLENDVDLSGQELLVFYKLSYPDSTVLVDKYNDLQQEMNILVPNAALKRSGKVTVEFALKQDEKLITVNKNLKIDVISTINSTYLKAAAEGELLETITEQIAKIEELINTSDKKIEEYNTNATNKTAEFDTHVTEEIEKAGTEINKKAVAAASSAATEANKLVADEANKVINAISDAGSSAVTAVEDTGKAEVKNLSEAKEKAISALKEETKKQVAAVEDQGKTSKKLVEDTTTEEIKKVVKAKEEAISAVGAAQKTATDAVAKAEEASISEIDTAKKEAVANVKEAGKAEIEKNTVELEKVKEEKIQEIRDIKYVDINKEQQFSDWIGTQEEYDAVNIKDYNTRYNIYNDETGDIALKFFKGKSPLELYDSRITHVLQARNRKLEYWDKNGDTPIIREGNKPLDDYIVAQGDWGTIYSDGGIVTVEQLAPKTVSDYNYCLEQLREVQEANIELYSVEDFKAFNFESLEDNEQLINDINNANIKEIDITYPIAYTDETGEETVIEKPVLKAGSIPVPVNFGCLVTKDNQIYVGLGYENKYKSISGYGLNKPILIEEKNGILKYKITGVVPSWRGVALLTSLMWGNNKPTAFTETISVRARLTYKNNYFEMYIGTTNTPTDISKGNTTSKKESDGWYLYEAAATWTPPPDRIGANFTLICNRLNGGDIINDGELFLEIDDNSFLYTTGGSKKPYIPQGTIVSTGRMQFNEIIDFKTNSLIIKKTSASGQAYWVIESNDELLTIYNSEKYNDVFKSSLYSNAASYIDSSYWNNIGVAPMITDNRQLNTFEQLLIYNGSLTEEELKKQNEINIKAKI